MSARRLFTSGLAAVALMTTAPWVAAADAAVGVAVSKTSISALLRAKPVGRAALAAQRGGTDEAAGVSLNGTVSNTSAVNVTTGANTLAGGAFAGSNGLPMVVQNSGNNVLIQTSTIVNITVN